MYLLSRFVCNVLGNLYPAYASYKAVLSKDPALHQQWLMYWIVNTFFLLFEMCGDVLISWVPLYYEAKIAFIVWLTLPRFKGATVIYKKFVEPFLQTYESTIDDGLAKAHVAAGKHVRTASDMSTKFIQTTGSELLRRAVVGAATLQTPRSSRSSPNNDEDSKSDHED